MYSYAAAAKLLAEVKYETDYANKSGAKRKAASSDDDSTKKVKGGSSFLNNVTDAASTPKMSKADAEKFLNKINAVEGVPDDLVYDGCPQIVTKIKAFLQRDGITKNALLKVLGNINSNSMNRFLAGKGQDQCGNVTYEASYIFFEKLRILEGEKKSIARLKNEEENPMGFLLEKQRAGNWIFPF